MQFLNNHYGKEVMRRTISEMSFTAKGGEEDERDL